MSSPRHPVFREIANGLHRALSLSPVCSKMYLTAAGFLLRNTPAFPLKEAVIQTISSARWPEVSHGPRSVSVCGGISLNLIPHHGEFDFRALFSKALDYEREVFELLSERIDLYDAVVEVGANIGVFSIFFGSRLGALDRKGIVLCFEPSREAFSRLQCNLKINHVENVAPFNCAVGKQDGFAVLYEPRGHLTNGSLSKDFAALFSSEIRESIVPCVSGERIASLLDGYNRILLKIDAEGAERFILEGFERMIEIHRPDIVLEVLDKYVDDLNALSILRDGYQFFNIVPGGVHERPRLEAEQHRDYLLVHKSRGERDPVLHRFVD